MTVPRTLILAAIDAQGLAPALTVKCCDYSSNPWRIVTGDGLEVAWEMDDFEHPVSGAMLLDVMGYRTRRDAVDALGRLHEALAAHLAAR